MNGRTRYTCHLDDNHNEIKEFFQKAGCSVFDAARVGTGFPDLVIGYNGRTLLVEVKTEKGKLENTQVEFLDTWKGQSSIIKNISEAQELLKSTDWPKISDPNQIRLAMEETFSEENK